ncbi:MAG: prepilin peptidase [Candidatus Margulisbacteria bacterium]|nr:prepilin peptidase [Candidatus Margulisiibacteriota bacterium]MBU1021167.1 prepilin peptidase [Candidatus Margulisiibacteriota bacterium]MBU1729773.1 prepilin peptidase [Candidatus Margulisiibacteriota bacterium]MBU1955274.1 prepilin peptidase [Candidatus Margulisiibacteriota bacterium]
MNPIVLYILLFILGACVGSFLNVCISRLPKDQSVVFPPSHCPHCRKRLKYYDLIPVLSYLILGGKCRYCKKAISLRYPVVELLSAAAFVIMYLCGFDIIHYVFYLFFLLLLIIIFFTDLEEEIIPDQVIILGIIAGLSYSFYYGVIVNALVAMLIGGGFFFMVYKIAYWYYKKEGLGQGDIKLGVMLGACLGIPGLIVCLSVAYIIGAVVSAFLLALNFKKLKDRIPFGPFLVIGAVSSVFFAGRLIGMYLSLFR